jgi:hypothetical protein
MFSAGFRSVSLSTRTKNKLEKLSLQLAANHALNMSSVIARPFPPGFCFL